MVSYTQFIRELVGGMSYMVSSIGNYFPRTIWIHANKSWGERMLACAIEQEGLELKFIENWDLKHLYWWSMCLLVKGQELWRIVPLIITTLLTYHESSSMNLQYAMVSSYDHTMDYSYHPFLSPFESWPLATRAEI